MPLNGDEYIDKVIKFVLDNYVDNYNTYSYLEEEVMKDSFVVQMLICHLLQSCVQNIYKEYHTSLDNLSFIDSESLSKSLYIILKCVFVIETNSNYLTSTFCEPMLSKRNLYPKIGGKLKDDRTKHLKNIIAYCDGNLDLIDLSNVINCNYDELVELVEILKK